MSPRRISPKTADGSVWSRSPAQGAPSRHGPAAAPIAAGWPAPHQIDQLRRSLEAVAAKVRRHEEAIRRLERGRKPG